MVLVTCPAAHRTRSTTPDQARMARGMSRRRVHLAVSARTFPVSAASSLVSSAGGGACVSVSPAGIPDAPCGVPRAWSLAHALPSKPWPRRPSCFAACSVCKCSWLDTWLNVLLAESASSFACPARLWSFSTLALLSAACNHSLRHVPQIKKVIRQAFTSLLVSLFTTESSQVSGYTIAHQMNVRLKD